MTSPMPSSSNMPATRPRWSKTWLRYTRWSGIIISSEGEGIFQGLQGNIKMMQIIERDAESRYEVDVGIYITYQGETWEILTDFDVYQGRTSTGHYYCNACTPQELFPSGAALWVAHCFEPL